MKQIPLTQGKFALVDDYWFDYLNQFKWTATNNHDHTFYAVRYSTRTSEPNHKGLMIRMHHCIIGQPLDGNEVDHIDGDGLNNQRHNLRIVTTRKNQHNRIDQRNGKLVGAILANIKMGKKIYSYWAARIRINGKQKHLGYFKTEQEAHEAYTKALRELGI